MLLKNAALLTVFSLVIKLLGVYLRLFLSARIGSEGMGLYQLIMSVYTLFATFATAGFTVAVSRLVAEKSEYNSSDSVRVYRMSLFVSGAISITAAVLMYSFSGKIALSFLDDIRTATPLKILALSMPFMAFSACMKGYFVAKRQILKTATASLSEQIVKIAVIALFLNFYMALTNDIGRLCIGIVIGLTFGEIFSFVYLGILYRFFSDRVKKKDYHPTEGRKAVVWSILGVTIPISASVYVTSTLHTAENIMLPKMLERFSGNRSDALSQFGMIRGMVIPILFFPFDFLNSLVTILVPEISRLNIKEDKSERNNIVSKVISLAFVFSIGVGGLFYFFAGEIGEAFYKGQNTYQAIKILALVTPFMYIETITDGLLKGIGEQVYTLKVSALNWGLRLIIVYFLIPATGADGYLWLLVASNTFSYVMCIARLKKVTNFYFNFAKNAFLPFIYAIIAGLVGRMALGTLEIQENWVAATAGTLIFLAIFSVLYFLTSYRSNKKLLQGYV
jgi:stage V sporulation protein B